MHNTYTLMGDNSTNTNTPRNCETKLNNSNNNNCYNGKLMLTSLVALAFICILIAFFHAYARWAHRRRSSRDLLRPHADYLVFNFGPTAGNGSPCRGLDRSVIKCLPTFFYDSAVHDPPLECAVCLSEFVDGESGRVLPKCDHRFHVDCIDMWFCYHSNCPLCRGPVRVVEVENHPVETITRVGESGKEAGSSSGGSPELVSITVEEVVLVMTGESPPDFGGGPKRVSTGSDGGERFGRPGSDRGI